MAETASALRDDQREAAPTSKSAQPQKPTSGDSPPPPRARRMFVPFLAILLVFVLVALAITNWDRWMGLLSIQETDDAYIQADMTTISARVSGQIKTVAFTDFQRIKKGDLLLEIDSANYDVQVEQAEASLDSSRIARDNVDNQISLQEAAIRQAEAQRDASVAGRRRDDLELLRQQDLNRKGAGTHQALEQAEATAQNSRSTVQANEAAIDVAKHQLAVLQGTKRQQDASVKQSEASLAAMKLNQSYTRILAPFDGVVGQRKVQVGDYVNIGGSLIDIVPLPDVYIVANYKETQLTYVTVGDPVEITIDSFPGHTLKGHVLSRSPGTGAQFALLPPDNATGNFTKVVQRIAVKIAFDTNQPFVDRLTAGLSVVTRINVRGVSSQAAQ